jgi:hypothetical protein
MGDLIMKAGLLLPFILTGIQSLTSTIPREPYLLVEDSINFTDVGGRKYTMQYDYFQHWSNFEPYIYKQSQARIRGMQKSLPPCRSSVRFAPLIARGANELPSEGRMEESLWKVAPGDEVSATVSCVEQFRHAQGKVTQTRIFRIVLSLSRPPAPED